MLRLGFLISAVVLLVDQATKLWIVHVVMAPPRVIEVTPFFNIVMVWNRGASFGLFGSDSPWGQVVLGTVAVIICVALIVWLARAKSRWLAVALGLVIGGALGNLVDRIAYGAVADFLDFHAYGWHWPAFNAADTAICVGVGMLLLDGLIVGRHGNKLKA